MSLSSRSASEYSTALILIQVAVAGFVAFAGFSLYQLNEVRHSPKRWGNSVFWMLSFLICLALAGGLVFLVLVGRALDKVM